MRPRRNGESSVQAREARPAVLVGRQPRPGASPVSAVESVPATEVQEDDVLVGLDGYVIEVEEEPEVSFRDGRQYVHMGSGKVCITYHDSQGEECYLIVPTDSEIQVKR
jgi:hypothetical protein